MMRYIAATVALFVILSHYEHAASQALIDVDSFESRESEYTLRLRATASVGGILMASGLLALTGDSHPTGRRQSIFGALFGAGALVSLLAIIPARRRGELRSDFAAMLDGPPPTVLLRW